MLTDMLALGGRMGRARYMTLTFFALLLMTLGSILLIFPYAMRQANGVGSTPLGLSSVFGVVQIALGFWIALSSSIRRMRDMGWSAYWLGLCVVPVEIVAVPAMIVLSIAMSVVKGMQSTNRHGPDPTERSV